MGNPPIIDPAFQEEWDRMCEANKNLRVIEAVPEKTWKMCGRCGKDKNRSEYYGGHFYRPHGYCKSCVSERRKERVASGHISPSGKVLIPSIHSPSFPGGPKPKGEPSV